MIENIVDYMPEGSWHTQATGLEEDDEADDVEILDTLAKSGDLTPMDLLSKSAALQEDPLLDKMDWLKMEAETGDIKWPSMLTEPSSDAGPHSPPNLPPSSDAGLSSPSKHAPPSSPLRSPASVENTNDVDNIIHNLDLEIGLGMPK